VGGAVASYSALDRKPLGKLEKIDVEEVGARASLKSTLRSRWCLDKRGRGVNQLCERRTEMADKEPVAELHAQFSSDGATLTPWAEARRRLKKAELYWLSTVRPDGRPHVTPLVSVWLDGALYFCTGRSERKAKNLARNSHCIIMTGCNALSEGLDLVVEGDAAMVIDEATLQRVADSYASKYDQPFHFKCAMAPFTARAVRRWCTK